MKKIPGLFLCLFTLSLAHAQQATVVAATEPIYTKVDQMPVFGTEQSQYMLKSTKAVNTKVSGRVWLSLVVEKDGSVSNVTVTKGADNAPELNTAAIKILSGIPAFKPGMQNGNPARVRLNTFIDFKPTGKK